LLNIIIAHFVILHCVLGESTTKIQINVEYYQRNHVNVSKGIIHKCTSVFIECICFFPISQNFRPAVTRLFHADSRMGRWTDEQTNDTELPVAFPNFANALKELQPPLLKSVFNVM